MTLTRLKQYQSVVRQIEIFEEQLNISYISGVDTSKVNVSGGKASNPTESLALKLVYSKERDELCKERDAILKYIVSIKDNDVREIAMRFALKGQTFEQIGAAMNYDRRTVSKKINNYLKVAR